MAARMERVKRSMHVYDQNIPASSPVSWVVYQFSRASYQSGLMLLILLMLAMLLSMHLSNTIVIPNSSWQQAYEQLTFHYDKTCKVYLQWAGLFASASGHHIKVVSCHGCCCSKPWKQYSQGNLFFDNQYKWSDQCHIGSLHVFIMMEFGTR